MNKTLNKHFTLNKNFSDFRDHQLSSDPTELKLIVKKIRRIEKILGQDKKTPQKCEEEIRQSLRRSIAAAKDLNVNHKICLEDLVWVRPGIGLNPGQENLLIGKQTNRAIKMGEIIFPEMTK